MTTNIFKVVLAIALMNTPFVACGRILVLFYHPGPSHFHSVYPLFNELAERGHKVTVLSYSHVENTHENYNELLLSGMDVINGTWTYETMLPLDRSIFTMITEIFKLSTLADLERELALNSPHINRILEEHRKHPFDLVIVEQFITDFYLGLIHKLNVPFIGFSTCSLPPYYYDSINLPDSPSYVPYAFSGFSWNMNLYERTINWLAVKSTKLLFKYHQMRDNQALRARFGDDIPDVAEIAKKMSLTFVNQHYSYTGPKPLSHQLVELGGIHVKEPKPIPERFLQILENAKEGVLLVSWGGNVQASSIPEHIKHEMLKGFARLPLQVIWKWENASLQQIAPKNVHVTPWLPQRDLLCHPKVKAFWTHGGNLGTIESVHCGKPSLITPFYGDQYLNAAALGQRGIGFKQDLLQITADSIYDNVRKALDPKVLKKAKEVSYELRNRLRDPLETGVWYVEHTIATKGFELGRGNTVELSWFAYYSLDAITIVALSLVSAVYIIKFLFTQLLNCCCTGSKSTDNARKKTN